MCDALTLESDSRETLLALERANLFLIPLDAHREWYRYHHLFADFLRQRLHETLPEITPELFVRASQWYEDQGRVDEAIEHALAGNDVTRAARLLDENVQTFILSNAEVNKVGIVSHPRLAGQRSVYTFGAKMSPFPIYRRSAMPWRAPQG